MAGVALLAGASLGMVKICDEEGGNTEVVATVAGIEDTSNSEWILPFPGRGILPPRKQYLKLTLEAETENGFAAFYFGKGDKPLFSVFLSGQRTLLLPAGTYPPSDFFEPIDAPATVNFQAQVWPTSKILRIITEKSETRLPLEDPSLSNPAWQSGLARVFVANASVNFYKLAGMDVPSLLILR